MTCESSTVTRRPSAEICNRALDWKPIHFKSVRIWRDEVVSAVKRGGGGAFSWVWDIWWGKGV